MRVLSRISHMSFDQLVIEVLIVLLLCCNVRVTHITDQLDLDVGCVAVH